MSRAAAKVVAKDMAILRTSLLLRRFRVLLLIVTAFVSCGAAFSPGAVIFFSPLDLIKPGPEMELSGRSGFPSQAAVARHSVVLRRLDEMMFTERAVSTAV